MTPNILKKTMYHLKTIAIVHCLDPRSFYSRRQSFSNQLDCWFHVPRIISAASNVVSEHIFAPKLAE